MEMLRASAASACFLGIVFSVMNSAMPSDKLARQVNVIFSLILIIVTVAPFAGADLSAAEELWEESALPDNSYIYEEHFMENVRGNICLELGELLAENGIYPLKITVDINNTGDGSILINKAEIILRDKKDAPLARRLATRALGADESIIIVKTEDGGNEDS